MIVQSFLILFLLFALSRVVLRFRGGQLKPLEFIFWTCLFVVSIFFVISPDRTTKIANYLGIGRGADLITYVSLSALFYLIFRAYVMMENIRHEITVLIRMMAIEKARSKMKK